MVCLEPHSLCFLADWKRRGALMKSISSKKVVRCAPGKNGLKINDGWMESDKVKNRYQQIFYQES